MQEQPLPMADVEQDSEKRAGAPQGLFVAGNKTLPANLQDQLLHYLQQLVEDKAALAFSEIDEGAFALAIPEPGIPLSDITGFFNEALNEAGMVALIPADILGKAARISTLEVSPAAHSFDLTLDWQDETWTLVPGLLDVTNPQLAISGVAGQISGVFSSLIDVAGVELLVSVEAPSFRGSAMQMPGKSYRVAPFLKHIGVDGYGFDDLELKDAALLFDGRGSRAVLHLALEHPLRAGPLEVKEVILDLAYVAGDLAAEIRAQVDLGIGDGLHLWLAGAHLGNGLGWQLEGRAALDDTLEIDRVLLQLQREAGFSSLPVAVPAPLLDLKLKAAGVSFNTLSGDIQFTCVGGVEADGVEIDLDLEIDTASGQYAGKVTLGSAEFELLFERSGGDSILVASWQEKEDQTLALPGITRALGISGDVLDLPAAWQELDWGLTRADFEWDRGKKAFILDAEARAYGQAFVMASSVAGAWELAMGVTIAADGVAALPGMGSVLQEGANFFDFGDACLILSTRDLPNFALPDLPHHAASTFPVIGGRKLHLKEGLILAISSGFSSDGAHSGLQHLRSALPGGDYLVLVEAGASPGRGTLVVLIGEAITFTVAGKHLTLSDAELQVTLAPLALALVGTITIPLQSSTLVAMGSLALSEEQIEGAIDLVATTAGGEPTALPIPVGLKGVCLNEIMVEAGLNFEPVPGAFLGLAGAFQIGSQPPFANQFAFAMALEGDVPVPLILYIYVEDLSVDTLTTALYGEADTSLPKLIRNIKATNLGLFWCDEPLRLPNGRQVMPGFGLSGFVDIYGWQGFGELDARSTGGVSGAAQIPPLTWHDVLEIQGREPPKDVPPGEWPPLKEWQPTPALCLPGEHHVNGDRWLPVQEHLLGPGNGQAGIDRREDHEFVAGGGPRFIVNSGRSPFIDTAVEIRFFILHVAMHLDLTEHGFDFDLLYDLGGLERVRIDCHLHPEGFAGSGEFTLSIDEHLDVQILGHSFQLHLATGIDISLRLTISPAEFELILHGEFWFEGLHLSFPTLQIDVAPNDLKELAARVVEHIEEHAKDIFAELFHDVENLLHEGLAEAEELGAAAADEARRVTDEAAKDAQRLVEAAEKLAEGAEEEVKQELETARQKADKLVQEGEAAAAEIAHKAQQEVARLANDITTIKHQVEADVEGIVAAGKHEIENIGHQIAVVTEELLHTLAHMGEELQRDLEAIGRSILEETTAIWTAARKLAGELEAAAEELLSAAWREVKEGAVKVWHVTRNLWYAITG